MNLPNYLTLARIIIVPLLVVVLLTPFAEEWFGISSYAMAIAIFLTLARWYGLPETDMTTVFPNLVNFPNTNLGFMQP